MGNGNCKQQIIIQLNCLFNNSLLLFNFYRETVGNHHTQELNTTN